jgi:hypothetical protein
MKHSRSMWAGALVALALMIVPHPHEQAAAQSRIGANRAPAVRTPTRAVPRSSTSQLSTRGVQRAPRVDPRAGRLSQPPRGDRFGAARPGAPQFGARPYGSGSDLLSEALRYRLGDGRYGYGGRDYWRDHEKAIAKAHRDAVIANALVQVVGILATTSAQSPQAIYAPGPRVVQTPGHYETRRVLVREGYWESERVWVPERQDPVTGSIVEGHYELHRRWVPEVYEETQVWVPHRLVAP